MIYKIKICINKWSCINLYELSVIDLKDLQKELKPKGLGNLKNLINDLIDFRDLDYSILNFYANDCDFEFCVKDENDEIVFKTEDVREFKDRTFDLEDQLKEKTAKIPDSFYLYHEKREKGSIVLQGELNLDEKFDKEKLYLIRNMADPYAPKEAFFDPNNFIYYQRGTHHVLNFDKIELETAEILGMCKYEENKIVYVKPLDFGYQVDDCTSLLLNMQILRTPTALEYIIYEDSKALEYSFNEDSKTATVCSYISNVQDGKIIPKIQGELIIPSIIVRDGEIYSVTTIKAHVFEDCYSLTSITIPDRVTKIGRSPFYDCDCLTSLVVDRNNKVYDSRNNCNAIIETASNTLVCGCKNTIIPDSVIKIGEAAFSGCNYFHNIIIPDSVTEIGDFAFSGCSGLTSITIPDSVTEIGECAFEGCTGLTSITIPSSVTKIGKDAFFACDNLTSITIPKGIDIDNLVIDEDVEIIRK